MNQSSKLTPTRYYMAKLNDAIDNFKYPVVSIVIGSKEVVNRVKFVKDVDDNLKFNLILNNDIQLGYNQHYEVHGKMYMETHIGDKLVYTGVYNSTLGFYTSFWKGLEDSLSVMIRFHIIELSKDNVIDSYNPKMIDLADI